MTWQMLSYTASLIALSFVSNLIVDRNFRWIGDKDADLAWPDKYRLSDFQFQFTLAFARDLGFEKLSGVHALQSQFDVRADGLNSHYRHANGVRTRQFSRNLHLVRTRISNRRRVR